MVPRRTHACMRVGVKYKHGVPTYACRRRCQVAPSQNANHARMHKIQEAISQGDIRFVRVTNLGDFQPHPKAHLYLGQTGRVKPKCGSFA